MATLIDYLPRSERKSAWEEVASTAHRFHSTVARAWCVHAPVIGISDKLVDRLIGSPDIPELVEIVRPRGKPKIVRLVGDKRRQYVRERLVLEFHHRKYKQKKTLRPIAK